MLDTGPIVAHLDAGDQWHVRCAKVWPTVARRCVTTEAVVTEACHLVLRGGGGAALPLQFLLAAEIPIVALDPPAQRHAASLMDRYADVPMDYADATLVVVSEALRMRRVFTTDRRGFGAYRIGRGKGFAMIP